MFNHFPQEIRLMIWEQYFLDHFGCRPRALHLGSCGRCPVCRWLEPEYGFGVHGHIHDNHQGELNLDSPLYVCEWPTCRARFAHTEGLEEHVRNQHYRPTNYRCGICKMCYSRQGELKLHQRKLHGVLPGQMTIATVPEELRSLIHWNMLWPSKERILINHEALQVAEQILRGHFQPVYWGTPYQCECRIRLDLQYRPYFNLASWVIDVLHFDLDIMGPVLPVLNRVPFRHDIQAMAIDHNSDMGLEKDNRLFKRFRSLFVDLSSLRTLYLMLSMHSEDANLTLGEHERYHQTLLELATRDSGVYSRCSLQEFRTQYHGFVKAVPSTAAPVDTEASNNATNEQVPTVQQPQHDAGDHVDTTSLEATPTVSGEAGALASLASDASASADGVMEAWLGLARDLRQLSSDTGRKSMRICFVSDMRHVRA